MAVWTWIFLFYGKLEEHYKKRTFYRPAGVEWISRTES